MVAVCGQLQRQNARSRADTNLPNWILSTRVLCVRVGDLVCVFVVHVTFGGVDVCLTGRALFDGRCHYVKLPTVPCRWCWHLALLPDTVVPGFQQRLHAAGHLAQVLQSCYMQGIVNNTRDCSNSAYIQ